MGESAAFVGFLSVNQVVTTQLIFDEMKTLLIQNLTKNL